MFVLDFDMKDVEDNVNRLMRKKIKSIYYWEVLNEVAELYANAIEHYVPLKEGALRGGVKVSDGEIIYSAKADRRGGRYDYAGYQYMNEFAHRHTPGTYGHWDTHLNETEKQALYEDIKKLLIEAMNNE